MTWRRATRALERIVASQSLEELLACSARDREDVYETLRAMRAPGLRWRRAVAAVARRRGVTPAYVEDAVMALLATASELRRHDLYALLGVHPGATATEIRARWRSLAKRLHPDRGSTPGDALFTQLHAAYAVLVDPEQRARYDDAWRRAHGPALAPLAAPPPPAVAPARVAPVTWMATAFAAATVAALAWPRAGGDPLRAPAELPASAGDGARAVAVATRRPADATATVEPVVVAVAPAGDTAACPADAPEGPTPTPVAEAAEPEPPAAEVPDLEPPAAPPASERAGDADPPAPEPVAVAAASPPPAADAPPLPPSAVEAPPPADALPPSPADAPPPAAPPAPPPSTAPPAPPPASAPPAAVSAAALPEPAPRAEPPPAAAVPESRSAGGGRPARRPRAPSRRPVAVDPEAARALLAEFSRRYAAREPLGLLELFTADGVANGRRGLAIADAYATRFAWGTDADVQLDAIEVEPTDAGAVVRTAFTVRRGAHAIRGRAVWSLRRDDGVVRVARLVSTPPEL